jgi:hypothetical protein
MEKYSPVHNREPGDSTADSSAPGSHQHHPMDAAKSSPAAPVHDTGWFAGLKRRFPILQRRRGKVLLTCILLLPLLALLGLLALRNRGGGAASSGGQGGGSSTEGAITDDAHFYGQSEPVYPSRRFNVPPIARSRSR